MAMEIESKALEAARNDHKALFGDAKTSTKVSASTLHNIIDKVKNPKMRKTVMKEKQKKNSCHFNVQ
eukprot:15165460-Ditylum_brightwellii.AAC.1